MVAFLIGKSRLNRVGRLVQGHTVGVAASRPVPLSSACQSLLSNSHLPRPPAPRDCEQGACGSGQAIPIGCLNPTWCVVLPALCHPRKAAALCSAPPSLAPWLHSVGPSWCQAEDGDSSWGCLHPYF